MASQNAVSVRISPSGTVVDVYALQTNTNHETDWENRLKQIGPLLNYLSTWRRMDSFLSSFSLLLLTRVNNSFVAHDRDRSAERS